MTSPSLDVLAIGNAIVDVLARAEEDFLATHGMAKGGMTLIDVARAEAQTAALRRELALIETAGRLAMAYAEAEAAQGKNARHCEHGTGAEGRAHEVEQDLGGLHARGRRTQLDHHRVGRDGSEQGRGDARG